MNKDSVQSAPAKNRTIPLMLLFSLFLVATVPALFWGTQRVAGLDKYNLQPDEGTALAALESWNFPLIHWEGGGYFNISKTIFEACRYFGLLDFLQQRFGLQENGPILLICRFFNLVLVFLTGVIVFLILLELGVGPTFAYLGLLLYIVQPAVQVSGHYMRAHTLVNFLLALFFWIFARYYATAERQKRQSHLFWMFVLSGLLFSLRYPFGAVIIMPCTLMWKEGDYKRLIKYCFAALGSAFLINPTFFIHLKSALAVVRTAPYSTKVHALLAAHSLTEFFARLQIPTEMKWIFLRILPDSMGGFFPILVFLSCFVVYLFIDKNKLLNWMIFLLLSYFCAWIFWGQTVRDGLSRFSLPVLIVFAVIIPYSLFKISAKLLRGETAALLLCVALVGSGALFSTELLFEMTCCDPRYPAMENLKSEKFYFIEDSWDYGFFKKMSNLVATIPVADAPRYPGATLLYVDVSVKPMNPFQDVSSVSLVQLVKVRQLLPFWKDRYYLHDYKYFSPTVFIFRVAN